MLDAQKVGGWTVVDFRPFQLMLVYAVREFAEFYHLISILVQQWEANAAEHRQ